MCGAPSFGGGRDMLSAQRWLYNKKALCPSVGFPPLPAAQRPYYLKNQIATGILCSNA